MSRPSVEKTPVVACTTSGVKVTLYTCPLNCRTKVPLVYIVNANGDVSVDFFLYKASTEESFFIVGGKNLSTGESLQLSDGYIVLEPGDKLELTPTGSSPRVDALCTVEELYRPVG